MAANPVNFDHWRAGEAYAGVRGIANPGNFDHWRSGEPVRYLVAAVVPLKMLMGVGL